MHFSKAMASLKRSRIELLDYNENEAFRKYADYLNASPDLYDDTDNELYIVNGDENLYRDCEFKVSEFLVLFIEFAQKLHLSCSGITLLLQFITTFSVSPNFIPFSYYQLVKALNLTNLNLIKRKFVCIACNCDLKYENEACQNLTCQEFKNSKTNANKISPYYINHEFVSRFILIISKYWEQIIEYRKELKQETFITDVGNAQHYKHSNEIDHNSVSLILFIDQANFSKSTQDNNLYYILGQILELPIKIRNSKYNILHFLTWGGYIFNFNKVINFIKPSFTTFLQSKIDIPKLNISLRVNLFLIICDAPMTAKAFNIISIMENTDALVAYIQVNLLGISHGFILI
jgi:hypothetical protein